MAAKPRSSTNAGARQRERSVTSPDGRRWLVSARPVGVPKLDGGGIAPLLWAVGWLWHYVWRRGQWRVEGNGKPELFITHNRTAPEIPVQRKFELLKG